MSTACKMGSDTRPTLVSLNPPQGKKKGLYANIGGVVVAPAVRGMQWTGVAVLHRPPFH
ncbi:hypothetical protein SAY87_029885 [Trapa incisa]|uniref:Uncharacterized protein n=1 Tax=Trapa incisa TaxID=236973 RepID=A0AAN7Q9G2_9MYRT|nr:hypothetical protein SAY87_029885 [Trapa incisa]